MILALILSGDLQTGNAIPISVFIVHLGHCSRTNSFALPAITECKQNRFYQSGNRWHEISVKLGDVFLLSGSMTGLPGGQCHQRPMSGQRLSQTKGLCNKETIWGKPKIMLHYKMYMKNLEILKKIRKVPRKETFKWHLESNILSFFKSL